MEHGVQASFPLRDSGNDLIAVRGEVLRAIQVKSTKGEKWDDLPPPGKEYHILPLVHLVGHDTHLELDKCGIFLLEKKEVGGRGSISLGALGDESLLENRTHLLFPEATDSEEASTVSAPPPDKQSRHGAI